MSANGVATQLTPNDIIHMHDNGVSEKVINAMQQTASSQVGRPAGCLRTAGDHRRVVRRTALLAPCTLLVWSRSVPPSLPSARCNVGIFLFPLIG